jgi:hypothetical protein
MKILNNIAVLPFGVMLEVGVESPQQIHRCSVNSNFVQDLVILP